MIVDWSQFHPVATMSLTEDGQRVLITIINTEIATYKDVVYAWVNSDYAVFRIGTAMHPVGGRLRRYQFDINKALDGRPSATPPKEAEGWMNVLAEGSITAVMHQPPEVQTVAGLIRPYLNLERHMIRSIKPPFNRTHN